MTHEWEFEVNDGEVVRSEMETKTGYFSIFRISVFMMALGAMMVAVTGVTENPHHAIVAGLMMSLGLVIAVYSGYRVYLSD